MASKKKGFITLASLVLLFSFLTLKHVGPVWGAGTSAPKAPGGDTPQVELQVEVGWEGKGVTWRTTPAVIKLKNNGTSDLSGVVEVVNYNKFIPPPPGMPSGQASSLPPLFYPAAAFGERLSLPAGSEKQVILWFPLQSPERMLFRFRSGDKVLGSTLASLNLPAPVGPQPQAIGVLGAVPPALEKVKFIMPDGVPRAPVILPLSPRLLPETGDELDACSTILVSGFDGNTLTARQKEALAGWLRQGGHLIIGGGAGARQSLAVLPENTSPITVTGSHTQTDWQAAAQWLEVTPEGSQETLAVTLKGEKAVPVGPSKAPLGLEARIGNGLLTVLTFDPAADPWRSGALGQALWKKLLASEDFDPYSAKFIDPPPYSRLDNILHQTTNLPAGAFPGWQTITVFLLVFTALAGPVTFFVLRRLRRPEYTWLAVPVLGVIFAGAAYGYMLKSGGNVIINSVQVAEIGPGGRVEGFTAVGFFAPTSPVFEAALPDPRGTVRVLSYGRPPDFRQNIENKEPPYSLIHGSDLQVRFAPDSQWNMRSLSFCQEFPPAIAGLKADLKVEGTTLTGKIKNETGLKLDHVTLMLGDSYQVIPELAPGQEAPVKLDIPAPAATSYPQGTPHPPYPPSWRIFLQSGSSLAGPTRGQGKAGVMTTKRTVSSQAAAAQTSFTAGQPLPPNYPPPRKLTPDEQRRANLLENWLNFNRRFFGPYEAQSQPLTLVAWSSDPLDRTPTQGLKGRKHYLSMIVQKPALSLPPGSFQLPPGLVFPEIVENRVRSMRGYNNLIGVLEGYLIYAFRPELPAGSKIEKITVTFPYFPAQSPPAGRPGAMGQPSPTAAAVGEGVLEIYNAAARRWESLSGSTSFKLKGEYADDRGEVRLRVNGARPESGRAYYFLPPAVAYEGVVK
ncbi:MAG: hypothetical protein PWP65_1805 [Clostridia bacterium]|nr:hypothetical protein [Clostridia bacterium]